MAKELNKNKLEILKSRSEEILEDIDKCIDLTNNSVMELLEGINRDNYGTVAGKDPKRIITNVKHLKAISDQIGVLDGTFKIMIKKL